MTNRPLRVAALALAALLPLGTTGCASQISAWIVRTRDRQGDIALAHRNDADASEAYRLALKIDPTDVHAKKGLIDVQLRLARLNFARAKSQDALLELAVAEKASPGDPRVAGLRAEIEQAEIRRDIVASNFPSYRDTGASIRRQYRAVGDAVKKINSDLVTFDYTYNTDALSSAIRQSYALDADLRALTSRLAQYRQLAESGVPESGRSTELAPPASLLPLP